MSSLRVIEELGRFKEVVQLFVRLLRFQFSQDIIEKKIPKLIFKDDFGILFKENLEMVLDIFYTVDEFDILIR